MLCIDFSCGKVFSVNLCRQLGPRSRERVLHTLLNPKPLAYQELPLWQGGVAFYRDRLNETSDFDAQRGANAG